MVKAYATELRSLLKSSNVAESKAFLRSFINKITIDGTKATISYRLPVPAPWKEVEEVGVLPTTTPSGDRGIRTPDLCDANAALSQLSYIPTSQNYSIDYLLRNI